MRKISHRLKKKPKPYFSFIHKKDKGVIDETYYNATDFDFSKSLEDNWQLIRKEVYDFTLADEKNLTPYFVTSLMNAPEKWKAFSFYFWGVKNSQKAIDACPQTFKILEKIPNILSASVSVLEPHSEIKPHYGDTDAVYRMHLGLIVPDKIPVCGFRVGYEDRSWEEGKILIFNDAAYHKAWNKSDGRRVILLLDVLKPEYIKNKMWICARVHGNLIWQAVSQATGILKGKTNYFTRTICFSNALFVLIWLYFLNRKSSWL